MSLFDEEFDSFWDLSSMIHSKKKTVSKAVEPEKPVSVEVKSDATQPRPTSGDRKLTSIGQNTKLLTHYVPKHSPFLSEVRLYRVEARYSFYSSFREDALRHFDKTSSCSTPIAYFSYIPQYAQMSRAQLEFYFYFREKAREGFFIPCDVTYFWLFIYEIINLPDKIPPQEGVKHMCLAWAAFRDKHPKIDKYMTVWLADYCLVNALPCPIEYIGKFLPAILEHAGFKEFYLGRAMESNIFGVHTLLSLVSTYQWQKSKFILSLEEKERFHILSALVPVVKKVYEDPTLFNMDESVSTMTRDAYSGSLCGQNIKCRIEVVYHRIGHISKLNDAMTAAVKYAENKMRIIHGQKSRLSVGDGLLIQHKLLIDAYFDALAPKAKPKTVQIPQAEYEKQYDATVESVSFAKALSIENNSWENTRKLVDDIDEIVEVDVPFFECKEHVFGESQGSDDAERAKKDLLLMLLDKGSIPFDFETVALCEEINGFFLEEIGDVVISITETECSLIEDYREEIEAWLKQ